MRAIAAGLLALTAACEAPEDLVVYRGSVVGETASIEVLREARPLPWFSSRCVNAVPHGAVTADAMGRYAVELTRAEVGGGFEPACLRVQADFVSGARASVDVSRAFSPKMALPPLEDWAPGLTLGDGGTLSYAPANTAPLGTCARTETGSFFRRETPELVHRVKVQRGDETVWAEINPTSLPEEALEDFSGTLALEATQTRCAPASIGLPPQLYDVPVQALWQAPDPHIAVQGHRVPASRGAACPQQKTPCPLTDGQLAPFALGLGQTGIYLELAADARIRTVVLRGVVSDLEAVTLLAFTDGGSSQQTVAVPVAAPFGLDHPAGTLLRDGGLIEASPRFVRVTLPEPTPPARRFVVQVPEVTSGEFGPSQPTLDTLSEVSLFE